MNWFLIIGAIISLVGMFFHGVAGQTKYMGIFIKVRWNLNQIFKPSFLAYENLRNLMMLGSLACAFHHE